MNTANPYCEVLGIAVPRLEAARKNREANYYSLLIVALLERGTSITLAEAAQRFEEAGIAPFAGALASLKRCKPGRPPIYRDGELYALDPHDQEADLWAFRLGLRPAKVSRLHVVRPDPGPLPSSDEPLTVSQLDEAWREGIPSQWSAQRIAISVLDAYGRVMKPDDVLAFVRSRSPWSQPSAASARYWTRGAAIRVRADGLWELDIGHKNVRSARQAVGDRVAMIRRWAQTRPDPAVIEATRKRLETARKANAERMARLRRILIHSFPAGEPEAMVLLDGDRREIITFTGQEIPQAKEQLAGYDMIAGLGVQAILRSLDFDPGKRRLVELAPPQKTKQLNRRGRTLKITASLLIRGSCGIARPLADKKVLQRYLREGQHAKLRRRLEVDAKSLFALYQYGCVHGAVRLAWGFLDEKIPAPWVHRDEPRLYDLKREAHRHNVPLEIVVGSAPGWADPWSRAQRADVEEDQVRRRLWLIGEEGNPINESGVQLARLAEEDPEEK